MAVCSAVTLLLLCGRARRNQELHVRPFVLATREL